MGCDVHMYLEYSDFTGSNGEPYWSAFVTNAGSRDYTMFGLLAGVRSDRDPTIAPRGLPEGNLAYETQNACKMCVSDDPAHAEWENYCTSAQAAQWGKPIIDGMIAGPDWHTFSWLTADEYAQVLGRYMTEVRDIYAVEYDVILASMRAFEERGCKIRLIFWFDN